MTGQNSPRTDVARRSRSGPRPLAVPLLIVVAAGLASGSSPGRADDAAAADAGLEFRRVLIQDEQLPVLARGYLPVRESEFQRLLATAQRRSAGGGPRAVGCMRAEYSARFEDDALVDGTAQFEVRLGREPPALWTWESGGLPWEDARWRGEPPRAAVIGLAPSGQQVVQVERSGWLDLRWSLRGQRVSSDAVVFTIRGPRAACQSIDLDLPELLVPECESAIVQNLPAPAEHRTGWRIAWPGDAELSLRLVRPQDRRGPRPLARVRQTMYYAVDLRGLELQADLHLDIQGEPLRNLVLALDRRLRVTGVKLGDRPLTWSRRADETNALWDELVVPLPDLAGDDRRVHITAIAPGEFPARWKLPGLQPRNAAWLEGEAIVSVLDPLVATQLDVRGGRLVYATTAAGERRRLWQVRLHDADSQLSLDAHIPAPRLRVRSGTTVTADSNSLTGRYVAELTALSGVVSELEAELPRAWSVDTVERLDGTAVEDFQLSAGPIAGRQLLRIRLREPLAAGQTVRLSVRARRQPPAASTALGIDQLRLLRLRDSAGPPHEVSQLVAINSAPNLRPRFSGDQHVTWMDPTEIGERDAALVEVRGGGRVLLADRSADDLELRFERERPRFRGEIEMTGLIRGGRLLETCRLRLVPDSSTLDRILVYSSQARSTPVRWRVESPEHVSLVDRLLPPTGDPAVTPGETWELTFARPLAEPVVLVGERTTPLDEARSLALWSLPESQEQSALVRLAATAGNVHWLNEGLRPIADLPDVDQRANAESLGVVPGTLAYFRYEPASGGAILINAERDGEELPRVWAWRSHLATVATSDGTLLHLCDFELENQGLLETSFEIPAASRLQRLLIDGVDRTPPQLEPAVSGPRRAVYCPLPQGEPHVRVRLELTAQGSVLGLYKRLASPPITADFPILQQDWQISLPGNLAVCSVRHAAPADGQAGLTSEVREQLWPAARWSDRLWGLLLRPAGTPNATPPRDDGWSLPTSLPRRANLPHESGDHNSGEALADAGPALRWHTFQIAMAPGTSVQLGVCNTHTIRAFAWTALLITAGLVGWWGIRCPRLYPAAIISAGGAALVLPSIPAMIAGGVFLGTLLAPLLSLAIRQPIPTRPVRPPTPTPSSTLQFGIGSLLVLLALAFGEAESTRKSMHAQEPPPPRSENPAPAERPVYRVLVAVDEQRAPTSDYVHLPREFYHELRRRAGLDASDQPAWIIRSAEYTASLRDAEPRFVDLAAEYLVDVQQAGTTLVWPWDRAQTTIIESLVTRGGETVHADWQPGEKNWSLTISEPGSYRVAFRIHAVAPRESPGTTVEFAIPPVAASWIRLRSQLPNARLSVANDTVSPEEPGETGQRLVRLGATNRLKLQWAINPEGLPALGAEQFQWLWIRPGSVQLDLILRWSADSDPPARILQLQIPSQLRLLPGGGTLPVTRAPAAPGQPAQLAITLPDADNVHEVRLSFLLTGASGLGRLVVPKVDWLDTRCDRRWLGISVSPSLELALQEGGPLEPLNVPTFLQSWGPSDSLPQVAYRLAPGNDPAVLAVRQRDVEWTAHEQALYTLHRDRGELRFAADVTVGTGPVFEHVVGWSGAGRILDVTVLEGADQQARAVRWSVDQDGRLQILADQPLASQHRLVVRADYPLPVDKEVTLPALHLVSRLPTPCSLQIVRSDSLVVERLEAPGWRAETTRPSADEVGEVDGRKTRQVGQWIWTPTDTTPAPNPVEVQVKLNRPRMRGRLLTTMIRGDGVWEAALSGQLLLDRGRLESVRLEIPPEWTGPWQPTDGKAWTVRSIPGQSRRQLVVPAGIGEGVPWEFQLRGGLKGSKQDRVRAADLQLLDAVAVDRYIALPLADLGQRIIWDTNGLRSVVQPDAWLTQALAETIGRDTSTTPSGRTSGESVAPQYQIYQVVAAHFQAAIADLDDERMGAQVLTADHRVQLPVAGSGWGRTTLRVQAGTQHECEVDMPIGQDLVAVRVAGGFPLVRRQADRSWQIPLADDQPTQDLELTYRITSTVAVLDDRQAESLVPQVRNWPTEKHSLHVVRPAIVAGDASQRWLAFGGLVSVVVLGSWVQRRTAWRDWLATGPALPAAGVGLAWWLWFEPAFIGGIIAAAGLLAANLPPTFRLGMRRGL